MVTLIVERAIDNKKTAGTEITMTEGAYLAEVEKGTHTTYDEKPDILVIKPVSAMLNHARLAIGTEKAKRASAELRAKCKTVKKAYADKTPEYVAFKKAQEAK
jgi:hypothetical protein